jgi:hypothetical protein
MHRRELIGALAALPFAIGLPGCTQVGGIRAKGRQVMTVAGPIDAVCRSDRNAHPIGQ